MTATNRVFRDARDTVGDVTDARATVWRWRAVFQADFQARVNWCLRPADLANHAPKVVVNGDAGRDPLLFRVKAGESVVLNAMASSDPDGHAFTSRWWVYREAGSYDGPLPMANEQSAVCTVTLPGTTLHRTIHLILEVTDNGTPALTTCRRVVLNVAE